MAAMTLHAICLDSNELCNVQEIMDEVSMDDMNSIGLKMIANPVYIKRMSELCRDLVNMKYL